MDEYAHGVTIGSVGIGTEDVALEQFRVVPLDVLGGDDDFDLNGGGSTVWLVYW